MSAPMELNIADSPTIQPESFADEYEAAKPAPKEEPISIAKKDPPPKKKTPSNKEHSNKEPPKKEPP
eukprot:CAMPEP_0201675694 /NCGR_PEP_ID=MMETSP0494-20130426/40116_1 /ASSEMBLY_ACC=CAM_ASM_000839 /TAXON_ID=420259 /ORGANISM="Thalassiosira gravida, Strain GMp14c1" /LENGTH=66 /DNA_ID=CAMNT_0048158211 /DNA_START=1 /DNA_END=197 /DNA_ORIENTATION=-